MGRPITPLLTVDLIIVQDNQIVLIKRRNPPFTGQWALPGGFVEVGETVEEAAAREGNEETGLDIELKELVGVFSDPDRDPRGHTVSVCFTAKGYGSLNPSSDAQDAGLFPPDHLPPLAFDHEMIIRKSLKNINRIMLQGPG